MCHWAKAPDGLILGPRDEGTMTLSNAWNYLPNNIVEHFTRPPSSTTWLCEPHILHHPSFPAHTFNS